MKPKLSFYLLFIILVLAFTSCSQNKPKKVYLEWGYRMTIPPPTVLGEPFTAHHSLSFQAKDKSFQMQAQVEYENQELAIVGLNTAFATLFTLKQIENQINSTASIKMPIPPKFILGAFYLIFISYDKISPLLGKNIQCTETSSEGTRIRKIFINKFELFNIQYLPFKNGTKIIFHNKKRNLIFTIIEDYKTEL